MPANTLWNIAFGPYAFTVDRKSLTYRLVDTQTTTVWADGLSLGWIDIAERSTGVTTRYAFGDLRVISLSEKAGAQGKRILFGLDAPGGIPVDVYLTCTDREIQVTVEANRDTKTHRVGEIGLLYGLCAVPEGGTSYLVVPRGEGEILFAADVAESPVALSIWEAETGLTMPFVGAVRRSTEGESSALTLLTDSAYGIADLAADGDGTASLNLRYERDPERRRLDVRIAVLPGGDYISVARAYRDRIIGEGMHVTFRKKLRDRPELQASLGSGGGASHFTDEGAFAMSLRGEGKASRWDEIENRVESLRPAPESSPTVRIAQAGGDWSSIAVDYWYESRDARQYARAVPLRAVIYHDAVPTLAWVVPDQQESWLRALLRLAPPHSDSRDGEITALLSQLHAESFSAFLTEHRFLTADFSVEEARYSNGAHVIVNRSATNDFENADLHLPPFGFFVSFPRLLAHDALRIGTDRFDARQVRVVHLSP